MGYLAGRPAPGRCPELTRSTRATLATLIALTLAVALTALMALALPGTASAAEEEECGKSAVTPYGTCGMNLEAAWSHYTSGNPEEIVAYIEGGINWHVPQAKELVDAIYVNWHELPVPCEGTTMIVEGHSEACHTVYSQKFANYDVNHDGVVNIEDWAQDPRVHDSNGNGYLDPEDLIAAFSDGVDHDHDGYVNDISGWDFYDNQNDSATEDSTYEHSDNQMLVIHRECPKCMIMPVKAGEEALDRTDDLAKAWMFAGDAGASVIVSVTADLGYSSFMRETVEYLEKKGVAMVEASNDFDSIDHQGGMFWPYVLPGNGALPALQNEDEWQRSDYTSWGAHNVLTGATDGGTTSESTPTVGGAVALLQAYGRQAAEKGLISKPLDGPETEQELIATSRRITNESLSWPGGPGEWNPQYGYGIPNVYRAMKEIAAGNVPPVPRIESPAWYSLHDPTLESKVPVTGTIEAPRSSSFTWTLQAGLGGNPQSWLAIGAGKRSSGSFHGRLGTLKLSEIPESFWKAAFSLSKEKELETSEQYAVTLRVSATDASGHTGVERRTINVVHDPTWMGGFPLKLPSGGESQPALVDLQGSGRLDAVFGTSDGYVDAIDPLTHKELRGWPVHTDAESVLVSHEGVSPGYEPIFADVAVGDLEHDGNLDVVAATEDGRVFAWNAKGEALPGWPQTADTGLTTLPIPRPAEPYTRRPTQGFAMGGPVLYDLQGNGKLDVVAAAWDGYVHVWEASGANAPGWPVKVHMPEGFKAEPEYDFVDDQKLDSPPAVAYLEGHEKEPDLVVRPQYSETKGSGVQFLPYSFLFAYHANGTPVSNWPVKVQGIAEYYNSAQEFLTEGTFAPIAADVTGTGAGPDEVADAPTLSPPELFSGAGTLLSAYGAVATPPFASLPDVPVTLTDSAAFGKVGGVMSLGLSELGAGSLIVALEKANSGQAITNEEAVFPAIGGSDSPGYPANRQGADFLGEPLIAPVSEGGTSVVDGGDSGALNATGTAGAQDAEFPKWTTGWTLFSPAAGDVLSSGHVDIVAVTREGYLFAWSTKGSESENTQWWHYQHDEWNSGNYEAVTRPPGAIRNAEWKKGASAAKFTAPGATWYEGTPSSYRVTLEPQGTTITAPASAAAGSTQEVAVPAGSKSVAIQAVGPTGLLGRQSVLK